MKIPAVLKNGKNRIVSKDEFQYLLATQKIFKFKRSDGWAVVGCDDMRDGDAPFGGTNRREQVVFSTGY